MPPAPGPGLKNLRVALIQGSKITEDRSLKRRGPVTIGTDSRNTFVVPVSNLPPAYTLFEYINNQYTLVFTDQMEGKVKVGDADLTFAALKQQGVAKKRGAHYALPLNDTMKGRVSVGEVSLLFQFVTPPPEPPRPELPPGVKGSFFAGLDQFFFTILAISLFIHFTGASYIACQPMPEERELTLDELPDRFTKMIMPVEVKKPEPKKVAEKGPDKKEEAKEEKKEAKAETKADQKAALEKKVASKGLLKILGGAGPGGSFADVLGDSGAGSVASALDGASGVGVATADSVAGPKGGGAGAAAGIGDLGTDGAGKVNIGEKTATVIKGRVADAAPDVDSKDVDREALAKYVRSRKSAIQGCYEKELKRNPQLKGKVVVRFTITKLGRASDVGIEEDTMNNEAVGSCIKAMIRGWVFPFKPEDDVPVAYPFVFSPAS